MSPLRDDYLLRVIEQAFQLLRRIRGRQVEQELPAALLGVDDAMAELLGPAAGVAQRLDAATAVPLVADAQRAAVWARLLAERADLLHRLGDPSAADASVRALEVALEARELEIAQPRLDPELRDALDEALRMALELAPAQRITRRYRTLLGGQKPPAR